MKKPGKPILLTISAGAAAFEVDRHVLSDRLKQAGELPDASGKFQIVQFHRALTGDLDSERLRKVRAEAALLEYELQKTRGEFVPVMAVERVFANVVQPLFRAFMRSPLPHDEIEQAMRECYFVGHREIMRACCAEAGLPEPVFDDETDPTKTQSAEASARLKKPGAAPSGDIRETCADPAPRRGGPDASTTTGKTEGAN